MMELNSHDMLQFVVSLVEIYDRPSSIRGHIRIATTEHITRILWQDVVAAESSSDIYNPAVIKRRRMSGALLAPQKYDLRNPSQQQYLGLWSSFTLSMVVSP